MVVTSVIGHQGNIAIQIWCRQKNKNTDEPVTQGRNFMVPSRISEWYPGVGIR